MSLWPSSWIPSPPLALLILMIAGHVLADFLLQTREGVEAKKRGSGYGTHGLSVLGAHLVVLAPLWSLSVGGVVAGIALLHLVVDWAKSNLLPAHRVSLKTFSLDQAAHLSVILIGWAVLVRTDAVPGFQWIEPQHMGTYLGGAILASAFSFNATGGSVIVEGILGLLPDDGEDGRRPAGYVGAGRLIGILERTLMLALILYDQWAAIVLLIAAKSIARFEEIKVRKFAEYYLVGTLASFLVALIMGFVLKDVLFPLFT